MNVLKPLDVCRSQIGCFLNLPSPGLAEMIAHAGFDVIVLDMEHGPFDWASLENTIRACENASTACVIRVPERRREYILKALDSGASGVQVPMVETLAQAEEVVRLAKYPPLGHRGASFGHRVARYGTLVDKGAYIEQANRETAVIIHIENLNAVQNLDDILTVEGIDVIFIGPTDLAVSMGFARDLNNPEVQKVINQVREKALAAGKAVGILGANAQQLKKYQQEKITYLLTSIQAIVNKEAQEYVQYLKNKQ